MTPRPTRARWRAAAGRALLVGLGAVLVLFLLMPLFGLVVTTSWDAFVGGLRHPLVWPALRLSLMTTTISLIAVVVLGAPLAWVLARSKRRMARSIETLMQLPIVIPPAVAGVALLLAFGRRGVLAGWLYPEGWSVSLTTLAVVFAEIFVSAPFFVQTATSAFRRIDPNLILVARSGGASPLRVFASIGLPLAAHGLVAGAAMSWARSLGEFGATLMFAGNLTNKTQTLPLAIYIALESDLRAAQALSLILVAVAFALLFAVRARLPAAARAEAASG